MENTHFNLFSTCIPVVGASRAIICDLQRYKYEFIPNALSEILRKHLDKSITKIKEYYENENDEIIDGYFEYLIENEFGFMCSLDERKNFPELNLTWQSPLEITNAILDFKNSSNYDIGIVAQDLTAMGCRAVEIRIYDSFGIEKLSSILTHFDDTRIKTIYILLKFSEEYFEKDFEFLCHRHQRIRKITIHSSPFDKIVEFNSNFGAIKYITSCITSSDCCGQISNKYFRVNMGLFTESQKFNSCLNKKISVDVNGFIKNCPSASISFGKIQEGSRLLNAILDNEFKKNWLINKDQILVCKDCEFRYICTDCRVYLENSNNIYSKPLKCAYNPYTAKWEN